MASHLLSENWTMVVMYATENWLDLPCGAVTEWLRHRSCDQKVPSSIPSFGHQC